MITNPEQLSGASSQGLLGKRIPSERLSSVLDVGQCLSQSFRGVSSTEVYKNYKQAGIVASLTFGQVMQEQTLGSKSSCRYTSQFLNEITML